MKLFCVLISICCCFVTVNKAQHFLHTDKKRSSYSQPYASASSYSVSKPANSFYNHGQLVYPYNGLAGLNKQPSHKNNILRAPRGTTWNYESAASSPGNYQTTISNPYYNSYLKKQSGSGFFNTNNSKRYISNQFASSKKDGKNSVSKADAENAKFAGAKNQENDEARFFHFKHKKINRRFHGASINPCAFNGREASKSITPPPKGQGRFLWDINIHNYYPQNTLGLGCGGYGGFGDYLGAGNLGGGLLSDTIGPAYYPPGTGVANFLSLFAPGILQNSLAVTTRPQLFADYNQSINDDLQSDPQVDPNYIPGTASVPVRRPNRIYYDSSGAPPVSPGQLVGGISTTVNGIIQQLTGNVQPVYG